MVLPVPTSAFAAYSGLDGNLSKRQRRRRRKKEKQNSELSLKSEQSSTSTNSIINKRKRTDLLSKNLNKGKKQKLNQSLFNNDAKEVEHNSTETITVGKLKNLSDVNKVKTVRFQSVNDHPDHESPTEIEIKDTSNSPSITSLKKVLEVINLEELTASKLELLTKGQVVQKIKSKNQRIAKVKKLSKAGAKRKKSNNFVVVSSDDKEIQFAEQPKNVQMKEINDKQIGGLHDSEICTTELVGEVNLNQENKPTLISNINKKKIEGVSNKTQSVHGNLLEYQEKLSRKLKSSVEAGKELFEKIIGPFQPDLFFKNYWEKAPLYVPCTSTPKFRTLLSTQLIDDFLRNQVVMFGKHIDITSYNNGQRETHNLEGRALPHVVWDLYNHKCSVRLLCPQSAFTNVFIMNTKLQDYFGCFVGANIYLTPPNSQGFAPHYDDIEAFVLQIEGQKRWKIYNPRNKYETLPRYSSKNFTSSEVGDPIMEVTLNPGDVLYFPRGFIHQADTTDVHSLHITVSVYQKTSWIDLLEKALPLALSNAAREDIDFRRGLPLNFLTHAGMTYKTVSMRHYMIKSVKEKLLKLVKYLDVDTAVDMMGVQYVQDALPPVLSYEEASRCVVGNGLRMECNGLIKGQIAFTGETRIRFTRALSQRLIKENIKSEDGKECEEIRLYYNIDNSHEYHGEDPQYLVLTEDHIPVIKMLSLNYPAFTAVKSLPLPCLDDQASLVGDLWDRGLLMTEEPLEEQDVIEPENVQGGQNISVDVNEPEQEIINRQNDDSNIDMQEDKQLDKNIDKELTAEMLEGSTEKEVIDVSEDEFLAQEYERAIKENEKFISGNTEDETLNNLAELLGSDVSSSEEISDESDEEYSEEDTSHSDELPQLQ